MGGIQRRTKQVAWNWAIAEEARTLEQVAARSTALDLMTNAVALLYLEDGYEVLMVPDASDNHWRSFMTQVPTDELQGGVEVKKNEPLATWVFEHHLSWFSAAVDNRVDKKGGVRHREHVLPLGVLGVGRSAHLH